MSLHIYEDDVTPELAAKWLAEQAPNRHRNETAINLWAKQMREGRWQQTGEPVKFDLRGRMIDGQHRCTAIVRSGVTVRMVIISGLTPVAQTVMDTGITRKAGDVLSMNDIPNASTVAAAVKILVILKDGDSALRSSANPGNDKVWAFVQEHPMLIDYIQSRHQDSKKAPMPGAVYLAGMVLVFRRDPDYGREFGDKLARGVNLDADDPIFALRERLGRAKLMRERIDRRTYLINMLRAYEMWMTGRTLTKWPLRAAGGGDFAPSPLMVWDSPATSRTSIDLAI